MDFNTVSGLEVDCNLKCSLLFIWLHQVLAVTCRDFFRCGIGTLSCSTWDLISLTKDGNWAPCVGSTEFQPVNHQGSPPKCCLLDQ